MSRIGSFASLRSLRSLGIATSASLALAAAACTGGDDDGGDDGSSATPITFAQTGEAERRAVLTAAAGTGAAFGVIALIGAELDAAEGCPAKTVDGKRTIFQAPAGGCTGAATGTVYQGRAEAQNAPLSLFGDDGVDPGQPMELVFVGFRADGEGQNIGLDGSFTQSAAQPAAPYTSRTDMEIDFAGAKVAVKLDMSCSAPGEAGSTCSTADGAFGLLGGKRFTIKATSLSFSDPPSGVIELVGTDTLRVDLSQETNGCTPYTIDGAPAGMLCNEGEGGGGEPPPPESDLLQGWGYSCSSGATIVLEADTLEAATSVGATIKDGETQLEFAMENVGSIQAGETTILQWRAAVPAPFVCESSDDYGMAFVASDADGESDCGLGGDESEFPGVVCGF